MYIFLLQLSIFEVIVINDLKTSLTLRTLNVESLEMIIILNV